MYVSEICAEGLFVTFPRWLKNVKSRLKIALFSNKRHFEIWFPKKKTITFFCSKLSKLHKKDPILHVATTFSLKQGKTRTSHGPIPHPLMCLYMFGSCLSRTLTREWVFKSCQPYKCSDVTSILNVESNCSDQCKQHLEEIQHHLTVLNLSNESQVQHRCVRGHMQKRRNTVKSG